MKIKCTIILLFISIQILSSQISAVKDQVEESYEYYEDAIQDEFEKYWQQEKILALAKLCEEEGLDKKQFNALLESYIYSGQEPIRNEVFKCLDNRPSILKAREIGERIISKMKEFVQVFVEGMTG
ncbi:type I restriction endonuclease subunit R, EcoR124 family [Winogradskyella vincentii]|uniref:Type I restriction enzyme R protein C-terminal domain-containing protein n=1 Tax=Winogradskyella vincentii TaxID=2877122 RepID=A0ABS7Y5C3_9FLAO|nr:hypothetical protein [Winogradskyella vincentii]MCA0154455.1 hypothetical protein [Winogradskyella vincentii]